MRPLCPECGLRKYGSQRRNLCYRCYADPRIRLRHPPTGPTHVEAGHLSNLPQGYRGPPPDPTDAPPGTPEKVAVMEARAAMGWDLWHPLDAKGGIG